MATYQLTGSSIIAKGEHYSPPAIIDTERLGIADHESEHLVNAGVMVPYDLPSEAVEQVNDALVDKNMTELRELAESLEIDHTGLKKADLIAAIEAKRQVI